MRIPRLRYVVALVALGTLIAATPSASAARQANIRFDFMVTNLQPQTRFAVIYEGGVVGLTAAITNTLRGEPNGIAYYGDSILAASVGREAWSGDLAPYLTVDGPSIVGVAYIPAGASVIVKNAVTQHTTELRGGPFSIPTGLGDAPAQHRTGRTEMVHCRGTVRSCQARVSAAGGAPDRTLVILLPARDLWLESVKPFPRALVGTFDLSDGHFTRGRSEFVETLHTIRTEPRGSHLTLTFGTFP